MSNKRGGKRDCARAGWDLPSPVGTERPHSTALGGQGVDLSVRIYYRCFFPLRSTTLRYQAPAYFSVGGGSFSFWGYSSSSAGGLGTTICVGGSEKLPIGNIEKLAMLCGLLLISRSLPKLFEVQTRHIKGNSQS